MQHNIEIFLKEYSDQIISKTICENIVRVWESDGIQALQWPPYMGSAGRNRRKELGKWKAFLIRENKSDTIWIVSQTDLEGKIFNNILGPDYLT